LFRICLALIVFGVFVQILLVILGGLKVDLQRFLGMSLPMILVAVLAHALTTDARRRREPSKSQARSADKD
jgi:hypothetical protein